LPAQNFRAVKANQRLSQRFDEVKLEIEGGVMKKLTETELPTVALLLGLLIGLGIAVHEVFFLVALAIAFIAGGEVIYEHVKLAHHRP
jgi:hypothetical protein